MKIKMTSLCLVAVSSGCLLVGCGKTATPPSVSSDMEKPATTNEPVASAAQRPATPAPNAVAAAPSPEAAAPAAAAIQAPAPETNRAPGVATNPPPVPPASAVAGLAGLSQDQMVRGLQEALGKGLQQAVAALGHEGGFLTNLAVRIPMPEKLQKVEAAARAMKQDKLADDFVATMNHAAEQAVPAAGAVFVDALKQMTIADATSILNGSNDAATQYFQKTTRTNLYARFYPIVQKATENTGVTAAYKSLVQKVDLTKSLGGVGSALGGSLLDKDAMDVDAYVTNKAMDGLFKMVAEEEKQIRQNPVARTTDVLKSVFGALKR